jgi:6-pyruvoyltetrahydropterin/6-carboxytetrahydropterin synthase
MHAEIVQEFTFEAAHHLPHVPEGHRCKRLHGHSYRVSLHLRGPLREPEGWVMDFAEIEAAFNPLLERLDHRVLNEVAGLEVPTAERIAAWIWTELRGILPQLCEVVVWETPTSRASVRG